MARQQLILDRYRVEGQAGAGGYGTVLRAYDTRLKRRVAIKAIELTEADVARARLLAMEERIKNESADWDEQAKDAEGEGSLRAEAADDRGLSHAVNGDEREPSTGAKRAVEPLPWEDDFELPAVADDDFPDDPAFLSAASEQRDASARRVGPAAIDVFDINSRLAARVGMQDPAAADGLAPAAPSAPNAIGSAGAAGALSALGVAGASGAPDAPDPDDAPDADADDLFDHIPGLEEARTAAHLNDANIVTVYDCEVHGSTAYVVMEYVEGKTLSTIMREMGDDISLDVVAAVFTSVAHALDVAHDNDVLHLDIKPENVIVNKKGVVKVTDFGLATLMDASGQGTAGGGTIGYMPLEQMRQQALDVRTDEWALASLTYEMLSGSNPFKASTLARAEELIENAELVLPSLCWDTLDAAADDIMFNALDPDPDERYASVAEFADELAPLLGSARAGKRALAAAVSGEEAEPAEPAQPREPLPPLVDRLGPKGAGIVARAISVAGVSMVGAVSMVNMRFSEAATYGVASEFTLVFWAVLAALVALTAWRPAFGVAPTFVLFAAMLVMNHGFLPAAVLVVAAGAWWWKCGRHGIGAATSVLVQPLVGSVGFAVLSPVVAGAVLLPRDAAATAAMSAVAAAVFASLGSADVSNWSIMANAITPASAAIGGPHIMSAFVATVASPLMWCMALSWVGAAVVFSLFCERGTRGFDIAGACVAAAILVMGVVLGTGLSGMLAAVLSGASVDAVALWAPNPLMLAGAIVAGATGIILALMGLPDRVRLAEGEW